MVFDPAQPFEEVGATAFDPSQPFEEVGPTGGVLLSDLAGIRTIPADEPPVSRETVPRYGKGVVTQVPDIRQDYDAEVMAQYGIAARPKDIPSAPDRATRHTELPKLLDLTPGRPEDMKKIVKRVHGPTAELVFHEGLGDYVVKFRDSGETVPFNPPGLGPESLKAALPGTAQVTSELAVGGAGMLAGAPGMIAGVGIGAGLSKYELLQIGKEQRLHDMPKTDMLARALVEGVTALGMELTLPVLGAIGRRMIGTPTAKRIIGEISEEEMAEAVKKAEELSRQVEAKTGEKFPVTAGQAAQLEAPEAGRRIRTVEEAFEERLGPEGFEDIRAQQATAESALRREIFGEVPPSKEGVGPLGEEVGEVARRQAFEAEERIGQESLEQQAEAMTRQAELTNVLPTLTSAEAMRTGLSKARDKTFKALGKKYDELWAQVPEDTVIDMAPLREMGEKWSGRLDEDIFQSLTPEDKQIVADALRAGLEERPALALGKKGILEPTTIIMDVGAKLPQVSRALSVLKSELRYMDKAPMKAKARDKKPLIAFVNELQAARESVLSQLDKAVLEGIDVPTGVSLTPFVGKSLRAQISDLDAAYALAKQRIDESLINRMITKAPSGGWRIADDKVFDAFLRNPSETRNFVGLVNDPGYDGFVTTQALKDGIVGKYRDRVLDGTMSHKSFMSQYGASMNEIMSPKEMRRFSSLEKAQESIAIATNREKALLSELNKTFETRLGTYDAEEIFDKVAKSPSNIRRFKAMAPKKWDEFKTLYSRDLLNRITVFDDVGEETLSANLMRDVIRKDQGALRTVYGDQYVQDFKLLTDISQLRSMPKNTRSQLSSLIKEQPELTAPMAAWRSLVARPLSRAGLLTTSAIKMSRREARRSLRDLLTNPDKLNEAMQLYKKADDPEKLRNFLLSVGMVELERSIRDEEQLKGTK